MERKVLVTTVVHLKYEESDELLHNTLSIFRECMNDTDASIDDLLLYVARNFPTTGTEYLPELGGCVKSTYIQNTEYLCGIEARTDYGIEEFIENLTFNPVNN